MKKLRKDCGTHNARRLVHTMNQTLLTGIYAALAAFGFALVLCPVFIPYLTRLKFGQNVRDDGPQTHLKKAGTPTMGGIVIVICLVASALLFTKGHMEALIVLFATVSNGLIGFMDDYIKVVKKRSLGLRSHQKIICQLIVTAILAWLVHSQGISTAIFIPFTRGYYIDLGWLYYPFLFFIMIGGSNSVNLTDGLDELNTGITILVCLFFLFVAYALGSPLVPLLGAAVGALLGFLLFNAHPAKVFMGDTGSLALGGLVSAVALMLGMPILLGIVGFVYVAESLSVMIQVLYFKATKGYDPAQPTKGKRFFKMAPLHHHFEQLGWPETRVVAMFHIVTAILCLVGFLATQNMFL